jgi:hypothetical protein
MAVPSEGIVDIVVIGQFTRRRATRYRAEDSLTLDIRVEGAEDSKYNASNWPEHFTVLA